MSYGNAMNPSSMGSYGAPTASYASYSAAPAYSQPNQPNLLGLYAAYSASSAQYAQTSSAQMLQSFASLQANWSVFLGSNPQMAQSVAVPAYRGPQMSYSSFGGASNYDSYAAYYQQYCATNPMQVPAY